MHVTKDDRLQIANLASSCAANAVSYCLKRRKKVAQNGEIFQKITTGPEQDLLLPWLFMIWDSLPGLAGQIATLTDTDWMR